MSQTGGRYLRWVIEKFRRRLRHFYCCTITSGTLFLLTSLSLAQSPEVLIPFEKEGRWGYMNLDKTVAIPPRFDSAGWFSLNFGELKNDMAVVRVSGHMGAINRTGKFVLKPVYDSIAPLTQRYDRGTFGELYASNHGPTLFNANGRRIRRNVGSQHYYCGTTILGNRTWHNSSSGSYTDLDLQRLLVEWIPQPNQADDTGTPQSASALTATEVFTSPTGIITIILSDQGLYACSRTHRRTTSGADLLCLATEYDSLAYSIHSNRSIILPDHYPWVQRDNLWGILGYSSNTQGGFKPVEQIPPRYLSILHSPATNWYYVEYAPQRYGYVRLTVAGYSEYW